MLALLAFVVFVGLAIRLIVVLMRGLDVSVVEGEHVSLGADDAEQAKWRAFMVDGTDRR